jgi:septin family protein
LVTDVVVRYLDEKARFLEAVERGISAAERCELIEKAASDLAGIKNYYLQEHFPQITEPTVRTIYERVRSSKLHRTEAGQVTVPAPRTLAYFTSYVVVYLPRYSSSEEMNHRQSGPSSGRGRRNRLTRQYKSEPQAKTPATAGGDRRNRLSHQEIVAAR